METSGSSKYELYLKEESEKVAAHQSRWLMVLQESSVSPRKACDNAFIFLIEPPTLEDLEPPFNTPFQEIVANQRIAFPCPAKGV